MWMNICECEHGNNACILVLVACYTQKTKQPNRRYDDDDDDDDNDDDDVDDSVAEMATMCRRAFGRVPFGILPLAVGLFFFVFVFTTYDLHIYWGSARIQYLGGFFVNTCLCTHRRDADDYALRFFVMDAIKF